MPTFADSADARQLKKSIDWHLENIADDAALKQRLEGMAAGHGFGALTWYWAPRLYQRNRAAFRAFILQHFSDFALLGEERFARVEPVEWAGAQAQALDEWLAEVDRADDVALFRKLYAWKHRDKKGWGLDEATWSRELADRFVAADTPAGRARVLEKFEQRAQLAEADALRMYQAAGPLATDFIVKHLPYRGWRDNADGRWQRLAEAARARGDHDFAWRLYRRQVPLDAWRKDVNALARSALSPQELLAALEQRHPEGTWWDLGSAFEELLVARGTDVMPYVQKHLQRVWHMFGRDSGKAIARLAKSRGWVDFRIAVLVKCGDDDAYNEGLLETLNDASLDEPERLRRLALFSGVSREWNYLGWGLATVQQLDPKAALALYQRYPDLVRTQFKAHVTPAWRHDYVELFDRAWAAGDEELADHLASRYVTRGMWGRRDAKELAPAERVADLLVGLKLEPGAFARRAASILTRVPAYAVRDYASLVRNNRLARLLYERSMQDYLGDAAAVRDLVEGSEIHVQRLAYRVLGLDDARARQLAWDNIEILLGTLLRPLHRDTRIHAFGALKNAAHEAQGAAVVLARAREAFTLPDQHYPKEALLDLVAHVVARHPQLAAPGETRVVYRKAA